MNQLMRRYSRRQNEIISLPLDIQIREGDSNKRQRLEFVSETRWGREGDNWEPSLDFSLKEAGVSGSCLIV
jgi:hypothetical protein